MIIRRNYIREEGEGGEGSSRRFLLGGVLGLEVIDLKKGGGGYSLEVRVIWG